MKALIVLILLCSPVFAAPALNFKPGTLEAIKIPVTPEATKAIPKFTSLRDPFSVDFAYLKPEARPILPGTEALPPPEAPKPVLVLQGIFITGDMHSAIIDDKVVMVGSRVVGGWRVSNIKPDMVILSKGGNIKTLNMKVGVE